MARYHAWVVALALALLPGAAQAGNPTKLPAAPALADRPAYRGLPLQVSLQQKGLISAYSANLNIESLLKQTNGAGTSEPAILYAMATRETDVLIAPLQKALAGFDADALVLAAVQEGLGKSTWFHPSRSEVVREADVKTRGAFVAQGPGGKAALADISYYIEPQGARLEAVLNIAIAKRGTGKPDLVIYHRVTSVVQLDKPSIDPRENLRAWSANGGALAKSALTASFARLGQLAERAIDMTPQEVAALSAKDAPRTYVAGRYGAPVSDPAAARGMVTIWARGLVSVQKVAPAG